MKILHLIHSMAPEAGGPAHFLSQLSTVRIPELEMEIACLDSPDKGQLTAVECPLHALGPSTRGYGFNLHLIGWLAKNRSRFDLIVVHGIWQYGSLACWLALSGRGAPYMVYVHGMLDPWFNRQYPLKHLKKAAYWQCIEYCVLRDAKAVLFTCDRERQLARSSFIPYQCREIVVGHGTLRPNDNPEYQRDLFFERFPQLVGQRILLFMGRLAEKKGIDLLLAAFAQLPSDQPLKLVLAGPDSPDFTVGLDERLAGLPPEVRARVTKTGLLLGDLKWGALRAAEAFILPSHQENFGQSVSEALSCGVPVLLSNQVNIWPEVCNAEAGLVEPDNLMGVKALLTRWLSLDAESRDKMRQKATTCYENHFAIERAAGRLIKLGLMADSQPGSASR